MINFQHNSMMFNKLTVFALLVVIAKVYGLTVPIKAFWKPYERTLSKNSNVNPLNTDKNNCEGWISLNFRLFKDKLLRTTYTKNPTTANTSNFTAEDNDWAAKPENRTETMELKDATADNSTKCMTLPQKLFRFINNNLRGFMRKTNTEKPKSTEKPKTTEVDHSGSLPVVPANDVPQVDPDYDSSYIPDDDEDFALVDISVTLFPEDVGEATPSVTTGIPVIPVIRKN